MPGTHGTSPDIKCGAAAPTSECFATQPPCQNALDGTVEAKANGFQDCWTPFGGLTRVCAPCNRAGGMWEIGCTGTATTPNTSPAPVNEPSAPPTPVDDGSMPGPATDSNFGFWYNKNLKPKKIDVTIHV